MLNKFLLILTFSIVSLEAANARKVGSAIAPPTYVGDISVKGDMGYTTENYKGVWLAHYKCKEAYPNSRAALYDDIKYIYTDLSNITEGYWLLDPYIYHTDDDKGDGSGVYRAFAKTGQAIWDQNNTCQGWTSSSSGDAGIVLDKNEPSLKLWALDCSVTRKIPCVVE